MMPWASPEFWVAVGFVILVAAIFKPIARAAGSMLDARAERIKATLDEAARLREEAQHLLAEYQRKQRGAAQEAEDILTRAREEAARQAAEAQANLEATLTRRETLAREKIAQAEAEALRALRHAAADIAIEATRRLIAEHLADDRAGALIDDTIADLPGKLN